MSCVFIAFLRSKKTQLLLNVALSSSKSFYSELKVIDNLVWAWQVHVICLTEYGEKQLDMNQLLKAVCQKKDCLSGEDELLCIWADVQANSLVANFCRRPRFWVHACSPCQLKVVHNNCPRGILLSAIVALKSIVTQRFSAVWSGLNRRTDPYWNFYHSLGTGLSAGNEAVYFVFRTEAVIAL